MRSEMRQQVQDLRDRAESEEDWQTVADCEEALDGPDEGQRETAMQRVEAILAAEDDRDREQHREAMSQLRSTVALLERLKVMP